MISEALVEASARQLWQHCNRYYNMETAEKNQDAPLSVPRGDVESNISGIADQNISNITDPEKRLLVRTSAARRLEYSESLSKAVFGSLSL
jgi:hypothetical protein